MENKDKRQRSGSDHWNFGRVHSAESSEAKRRWMLANAPNRGVAKSEETKAKIREARKRQVHPRLANRGITAEMVAEATANGLKWCSGACKAFIPADRFSHARCVACRQCTAIGVQGVRDRWTEEERAKSVEAIKGWRDSNPEEVRRIWLFKKYGVTPEWYEEKLAAQDGHCALCPATVDERKMPSFAKEGRTRSYLLVDHDHETGKARGLLCAKCNTALHRVEYSQDWAWKAMAYLERHGKPS